MSRLLDKVQNYIISARDSGADSWTMGRRVIEIIRDLPEEPGLRYTAGEYSRRNIEAMVDDALS
jgi:hypothetical protein